MGRAIFIRTNQKDHHMTISAQDRQVLYQTRRVEQTVRQNVKEINQSLHAIEKTLDALNDALSTKKPLETRELRFELGEGKRLTLSLRKDAAALKKLFENDQYLAYMSIKERGVAK